MRFDLVDTVPQDILVRSQEIRLKVCDEAVKASDERDCEIYL